MKRMCWLLALAALPSPAPAGEAGQGAPKDYPVPAPSSKDEPLAARLSPARAGEYMDGVTVLWTRGRRCGACHTSFPYLMARPLLGQAPAQDEVRGFFESRVANWDRGEKGDAPRWDTEVVATAVTLAAHDARTTGKLHPLTRKALDRMWTLQKPDGAWSWLKCDWPPMEHDDYFGAVFAALGVGLAPDGYAATPAARAGLARLRAYLRKTPPPDLHHRTWLLWASTVVPDLLTEKEQQEAVRALLTAQRKEGGWSLSSLGAWKRRDGTPNDPEAPSDGYGTGLAVVALRRAGVPADSPALRQAADWLRTHQRESGRWFTRSLNNDRLHLITNAGTCFAVMALEACGELAPSGKQ